MIKAIILAFCVIIGICMLLLTIFCGIAISEDGFDAFVADIIAGLERIHESKNTKCKKKGNRR